MDGACCGGLPQSYVSLTIHRCENHQTITMRLWHVVQDTDEPRIVSSRTVELGPLTCSEDAQDEAAVLFAELLGASGPPFLPF